MLRYIYILTPLSICKDVTEKYKLTWPVQDLNLRITFLLNVEKILIASFINKILNFLPSSHFTQMQMMKRFIKLNEKHPFQTSSYVAIYTYFPCLLFQIERAKPFSRSLRIRWLEQSMNWSWFDLSRNLLCTGQGSWEYFYPNSLVLNGI